MWDRIKATLREWYIVIAGAILILGGLYLASAGQEAAQTVAENTPPSSSSQAVPPQPAAQPAQPAPSPSQPAPPPKPATPQQAAPAAAPPAPAPATPPPPAAPQTAPAAVAVAGLTGDPQAGQQVFKKCQVCHSVMPGKNLVGPSLAGVIGRKAGTAADYSYSSAMKDAGFEWTPAKLDAYLTDPQKVVPGNKMPFPGLKTPHDRADVIAFLAKAGVPAGSESAQQSSPSAASTPQAPPQPPAAAASQDLGPAYVADAKFTLKTGIAEGRMVFIGVGGTIDGKVNPVLTAAEGQVVQVTLINGEGAQHDVYFPDQDAKSPRVTGKGASTTLAFRAGKSGDFVYYCTVPGHRQAGMEGQFVVTPKPPAQTVVEADISRDPTDLPPPIGKREPQTVRVDLLAAEVQGRLAEGTTYDYWTFNGRVPGPFIRVRVGDTVDIHLKNSAESSMIHSVDFHAVIGPGGGAAALQVNPGEEKSMTWKALVPGLYVYHCATPMVAEHIANGMFGLILVEPQGGLPQVDHEFYVMQSEIYTDAPFGQRGSPQFSVEKLLDERPEYFVFNGSVGAISRLHPLHAKVGDTVRIFFGDAGPNFTSSFHVIGEIFDRVYQYGSLLTPPLQGVQTITVPAGGAAITEFKTHVPGNYTLVDHALSRAERGAVGVLSVDGPPNTDIYNGVVMPGMGH
jgi:nitrite reductase (NO-forming)